jgi:poly-gamma-glutamate capsule biosynthesis protein CapA/YwtB (metallophosphatase superfamily)
LIRYILILFIISLTESSFTDSLSVLFLGDTYFGENYQNDPKFNYGTNIIEERGYDSFFENVKELLLGSDYAIANLETTLFDGDNLPSSTIGNYIHYGDTKNTPHYLSAYNIKAVSLANNHSLDLGNSGLTSTIKSLVNSGITTFGAGNSENEASAPFIREFITGGKTIRLYVIGCYWQRSFYEERGYYASGSRFGVYMLDTVKIGKQIIEIRSKDTNAFIVVYPHWGSNYNDANDIQKSAARSLINSGADMIIGHAAHTVQEAELYNGKWIFYNIGNFIFNAPGRYRSTKAKPYGIIFKLIIKESLISLRLYGIYTDNKKSDYKLRYLNENELRDCLKSLETESSVGKLKISNKGFIEVY